MNTENNITFSKGFVISRETMYKPILMKSVAQEQEWAELNEEGELSISNEAL